MSLPVGFSESPPRNPWGINFGGGLNSTALIIECFNRGYKPYWILFADTGSEFPGTLEHVELMAKWCKDRRWTNITTVRWIRKKFPYEGKFLPLHEWCIKSNQLPSKAYGLAGCTTKWKVQPMDKWRKKYKYQKGCFAVGYDADEKRRITSACKRGDMPGFTAWYPLVAWGINREGCKEICDKEGISVGKSSCFMCPNMRAHEWKALKETHPELFNTALEIQNRAKLNGHFGRGGRGLGIDFDEIEEDRPDLEDRCHHGGCFT